MLLLADDCRRRNCSHGRGRGRGCRGRGCDRSCRRDGRRFGRHCRGRCGGCRLNLEETLLRGGYPGAGLGLGRRRDLHPAMRGKGVLKTFSGLVLAHARTASPSLPVILPFFNRYPIPFALVELSPQALVAVQADGHHLPVLHGDDAFTGLVMAEKGKILRRGKIMGNMSNRRKKEILHE